MKELTAQQAMHVGRVVDVVMRAAKELPTNQGAIFPLLGEIDRINFCAELLDYGSASDLEKMPLHKWIDAVVGMAGRMVTDYTEYLAKEINPAIMRHKDQLAELIGGLSNDADTGGDK